MTFMLGPLPLSKEEHASLNRSDIATFGWQNGIWVNGTQPVLIWNGTVAWHPTMEFPFTRLASVTSNDGSATYLYHQMNGSTLAEEQWDNVSETWLSTKYITVSDS